jgi:hypothetical protein
VGRRGDLHAAQRSPVGGTGSMLVPYRDGTAAVTGGAVTGTTGREDPSMTTLSRTALRIALLATLLPAVPVLARDVPLVGGDLAITYGRNWSQDLNVAGVVAELEVNVLPQLAVGVRAGGALGVGLGRTWDARGFAGLPFLAKAEATPFTSRTRPYVGLGLGVTRVAAGGTPLIVDADSESWSVTGPVPTLMPELGLDAGGFRIALVHASLIGTGRLEQAPDLSGTALQLGAHFGGPRR